MVQTKPKLIQPSEPVNRRPVKFTYALKSYTMEMRPDGWWITKTPLSIAQEKPSWIGPFLSIEDACIAIARCLAVEVANRHASVAANHGIKRGDPLYGLQGTRLSKPRRKSA